MFHTFRQWRAYVDATTLNKLDGNKIALDS